MTDGFSVTVNTAVVGSMGFLGGRQCQAVSERQQVEHIEKIGLDEVRRGWDGVVDQGLSGFFVVSCVAGPGHLFGLVRLRQGRNCCSYGIGQVGCQPGSELPLPSRQRTIVAHQLTLDANGVTRQLLLVRQGDVLHGLHDVVGLAVQFAQAGRARHALSILFVLERYLRDVRLLREGRYESPARCEQGVPHGTFSRLARAA